MTAAKPRVILARTLVSTLAAAAAAGAASAHDVGAPGRFEMAQAGGAPPPKEAEEQKAKERKQKSQGQQGQGQQGQGQQGQQGQPAQQPGQGEKQRGERGKSSAPPPPPPPPQAAPKLPPPPPRAEPKPAPPPVRTAPVAAPPPPGAAPAQTNKPVVVPPGTRPDRQETRERRDERRDDRKDVREERKDDRKDVREERKDDRKDVREERKDDRKDVREERKDDRKDVREERREERRDERREEKPALRTVPGGVPGGAPTGSRFTFEKPREDRAPRRLEAIKEGRRQSVEDGGRRTIIREPDNRVIIRQDNRVFIQSDHNRRFERFSRDARQERRRDGTIVTIVERPGGVRIYTVTDRNGRLLHRYRRDRDGREITYIDNRRRDRFGRYVAIGVGIGVGALIARSIVDLPPPRIAIARDKYIVDYDSASEEDIYEALSAPPLDELERGYTLDEVLYSPRLRDRMRRVDLNTINFEFGSWEVDESQYGKLERIANAMLRVIDRNEAEMFLVEGYTDAVGIDEDNLTLSDRRAEAVAVILTEQFDVPPENLTTQGYGEQYLKVETEGPERLNRRVAFRRITPLLSRDDRRER